MPEPAWPGSIELERSPRLGRTASQRSRLCACRSGCASAPGGRLLEFDGIVATVMPAMPERSVWNAVVYERADALASTLDELAATYEEVGVKAWMVWVPSLDGEARKLLRRAGHRLDA